jgi:hypothetical protein
MTRVIEEAYEVVESGLISEEDFRDFVFTNPVTLWAGTAMATAIRIWRP